MLLTSSSPEYKGFAFDVLLNTALNTNYVQTVMCRGLENIHHTFIDHENQQNKLAFDEIDALWLLV